MSMREEFEAFRDERNALLASEGHTEKSRYWITNAHYPTWEASRAALVVELGKRWSNQDGDWFEDEDGDSLDYSETVRALEAAGVQVKP
ncbi:hypothetical protein [Pseudomonas luteola]|uniref:Uncharacterized protein n=1 Tax=Pseudomonas luteola TaxID=47886 RepID=A0ABS0MUT5_PSELU|nr:hypothetical protein [Pseudomonas luteola]MBH3440483.1 hypothetical protein [Pseudomonas luteola]